MKKRFAYYSLGCKLNFAEASSFSEIFKSNGYSIVDFNEKADVYLVNTCTVTDTANKKSRKIIKSAIKKNPEAIIIVTGCYAQLKSDEVAKINGVDYVFGTGEKDKIVNAIGDLQKNIKAERIVPDVRNANNFFAASSAGQRTRSFLKIQDGCDKFCSYCTIPLARGKSRNSSIEDIITSVEKTANKGFKEIVLTGVNIGDFGKSTNESFKKLLEKLGKVNSVDRYRVSSIEPDLLDKDIIDFIIEHPRFMPHFHIPLQSGDDSMLSLMRRDYDTDLFNSVISYIRKKDKYAFIGVDLIVGVPGETEELFGKSADFVSSLDVSFIHVFTYSERENTLALKHKPVVPYRERKLRSEKMHLLSETKKHEFYKRNKKQKRNVLFEESSYNGLITGFTDNYIRAGVRYDKSLVNKIIPVSLDKLSDNDIFISKIIDK